MLLQLFEEIPDKRRAQARKYDLPHLLLYSLIAVIAGCNRYKDIEIYIRMHLEELNEYFGSNWKRGPSHSTINYFFITLNCEALERVFRKHANKLAGDIATKKSGDDNEEKKKENNKVAFDGKVLRGSLDKGMGTPALQMISAYLIDKDIILAHEFIAGQKTNEIPVVQQMVKDLGLQRFVATADALHCQKKHSKKGNKRGKVE